MLERFEQKLGIDVPTSPGLDTMACMDAAHRGEMDFALCLGGNLFGSNPDHRYAAEAMNRLTTLVHLSTTLNTGHVNGLGQETLILPVLPRDEEPQPTTQESMFSYVRLSEGGPARFEGPRSEVSILAAVAERVFPYDASPNQSKLREAAAAGDPHQPTEVQRLSGAPGASPSHTQHTDATGSESHRTGRINFAELRSHAAIRQLIGELVPGYEHMLGIDASKQEFHVTGRAVENYHFPTATGKATFHAVPLPDNTITENELRLMTVRSEGQFNSVVYDDEDVYRGQDRRNVILMNAADLQRLGLQPDQQVRITSAAGELRLFHARPFDIRAGNALMYYPEANVLVPHRVDPQSKTPGFKGVRIRVAAEAVRKS
ncbi:MAG: molybdopterin dinucleotide binding domain-containing protein [Planctomycetaceae bacterium]